MFDSKNKKGNNWNWSWWVVAGSKEITVKLLRASERDDLNEKRSVIGKGKEIKRYPHIRPYMRSLGFPIPLLFSCSSLFFTLIKMSKPKPPFALVLIFLNVRNVIFLYTDMRANTQIFPNNLIPFLLFFFFIIFK